MFKKQIHYAWYILICCSALTLGSTGIIFNCAGIFISPVSSEFGVGVSNLTFYLTINLLTRVFVLPIVGNTISKINLKKLIIVTAAIQCIVFGLMSTFTSVYHYYIAGVIYGITSSITIFMFVPAILGNWFTDKLGTAIGIAMTFSGVGAIIFQPIGTSLISLYGWRNTYIILAIIAAVIILPLQIFVLKEKPSDLGLKPYGKEKQSEIPSDTPLDKEDKKSRKEMFKSFMFFLVVISTICISYVGSMVDHTAVFAVSVGIAVGLSGFVSSLASLGMIIGKPALGYLNDKIGVTKATSTYAIIGAIGFALLLSSYNNLNYLVLFSGSFLLGASLSLVTVEILFIVREVFGAEDYYVIYSYVMTISSLAMALGQTLNGKIFDLTGSYEKVFYIMIVLNIILAISMILIGKQKKSLEV